MTEKRKPGRPKGTTRVSPETSKEQRATFIIDKGILKKIKLLAQAETFRQRRETPIKLKEVVNDALDGYITEYENKNGPL